MKNHYTAVTDTSGCPFNSKGPRSSDMTFRGTVRVENPESRQQELCDVWTEGDLSAMTGMDICLICGHAATPYHVTSRPGEDQAMTISYEVLDSNHFSGNLLEEVEELRHLLFSLNIAI